MVLANLYFSVVALLGMCLTLTPHLLFPTVPFVYGFYFLGNRSLIVCFVYGFCSLASIFRGVYHLVVQSDHRCDDVSLIWSMQFAQMITCITKT